MLHLPSQPIAIKLPFGHKSIDNAQSVKETALITYKLQATVIEKLKNK